ncbi:MAG: ABC transporter permease [Gemmatimonadales bacterium]
MPDLRQDVRLALRSLFRRPGFVAVVVLTLGLGIGANSAIFSVVNAVLLKPLPYRDPGQLAMIWSKWTNFEKTWLSPAEYLDYQKQSRLFSDVAAWDENGEAALTGAEGAQSVTAVEMTGNFLDVVGMVPAAGRVFSAEEDIPNGPPVVMIGYELWQQRFGRDPSIVNRIIQVDGESQQVVGVLPKEFKFPLEFQSRTTAQLIQPARMDHAAPARGNHGWYGVARLKPGITAAMVTPELDNLAKGWTKAGLYPVGMQFTAFAVPMIEQVSGNVQLALLVLAAAVGLLLLLTCANVANLVLTRADSRSREVAVRAALGAGKGELLRLALTESMLLGLGGGLLGLVLSWGGVRILVARAPTTIPRLAELHVDWRVVAFTLVLSLVTGALFGLLPVARVSQLDLANALRDGSRGASDGAERKRGRTLLVVAEMALAVLLVISAGLTIKSFRNLMQVDPGFDTRGVLTMRTSLPSATYADENAVLNFYRNFGNEVRQLPGVQFAGFGRVLPLAAEMGDAGIAIEAHPTPAGVPGNQADWQAASPGYFEAMKIRLITGRYIDNTDTKEGLQTAVINEALAKEYFPGENPIGQRVRMGGQDRPWRVVVGVVGNYHHNGLTASFKRAFFIPAEQWSNSYGQPRRAMTLIVRSSGNPKELIGPVAAIARGLAPDVPVTQITTMDDVLSAATQEQRFTMALMAGFALLALVLAAVGIYGVISYSVSQRTREIGIRLALGADVASVRSLVLRQGMVPAVIGIGVGLASALLLTRYLGSLLYGVAAIDAFTFATIPLLLLIVAAGSVLLPAMRASRVEPVEALRGE